MLVTINKTGGAVTMQLHVTGPFFWVSTSRINTQPYTDNSQNGNTASHIVDYPKDIDYGEIVDWIFHLRNDSGQDLNYVIDVWFEQDGNKLNEQWQDNGNLK